MTKRGRPPLCDESSTRISISIPASLYQRLQDLAEDKDLSVASVTRAAIRRLVFLHHIKDKPPS